MPTFTYKAIDAAGTLAEGQLQAGSRPEAFRQMETRGLRPVSLAETAEKLEAARPDWEQGKLAQRQGHGAPPPWRDRALPVHPEQGLEQGPGEFHAVTVEFVGGGGALEPGAGDSAHGSRRTAAAAKWKEIHDLVIDGVSLADAMAKSPEVFPRVYTAMVQAGETGGFLDLVLAQIADFQAREKELRSKVLSALLYPCILVVLALSVLVFLLVFFIPRFQKLFAGFGGTLPFLTQVIIGASQALRAYGVFVAAGVFVTGYLLRHWFASEKGRRVWENLSLRLPLIGPILAQFAMARFCRMLGTLLGAGVPLVQGLNVARKSIGNQTLTDAVGAAIERVQEGGRLGQSLAGCPGLFSRSVLEMVSVAEESGRLEAELVRIAGVAEGDLDRELKIAVAFAEPLMLFVVAGFIGTIFIGMLLPIFTLQQYIK